MNGLLLTLAWSTPFLMLPLVASRFARVLIALAALPALLASVLVPVGTTFDLPWLLLGLGLRMDELGATYLLFSAVLWLFAGIYAVLSGAAGAHPGRFSLFFLLAAGGNFLLILAADIIAFYIGFAVMGLSATGLIAHRRSQHARRAARVYLAWTLVGEMALFAAVVMLAQGMDSVRFFDLQSATIPATAAGLLLLGFGIKLALPGLHFWLPLAYPAAPAVATALLSGPMISAGLLGWLRFLPPGGETLMAWGEGLLLVGIVGTALGVLAGLLQRDPRAVLAYSSIAKMGLVATAFGIALARPHAAPGIIAALTVFTMHHLILKGTLFLGIGEWQRNGARPWLIGILTILALAMAGLPFTSGAGAKSLLTGALNDAGIDLALLLGFSALGTLFLMARFLWLIARRQATATGGFDHASMVWSALAALAIVLPLVATAVPWSASGLGTVAAGIAIVALVMLLRRRTSADLPDVPPGDLLYLGHMARRLRSGRIAIQDLMRSPLWLIRRADSTQTVRTAMVTIWLFLSVLVVSFGLMPG